MPAQAKAEELEAGIDYVRESPAEAGTLELIVGRPAENERRRFGVEALKLVNSSVGRAVRLCGLNARVIAPGIVRRGDEVRKLELS